MASVRMFKQCRDALGHILVIAHDGSTYVVGVLTNHGRIVPLDHAHFWTYTHADARLRYELATRQAQQQCEEGRS
jgi:hypothetical protein